MRSLGWLDLRLACTRHLRNCHPSAEQSLSRLPTSSGRSFVSTAGLRKRSDLDLHLREGFDKATRLMNTHERYKGWEPSALLDRIAHLEKDLESARSKEGRGADGAVVRRGTLGGEGDAAGSLELDFQSRYRRKDTGQLVRSRVGQFHLWRG